MTTRLYLPYEAINTIPGGVNEVRRYYDPLLQCERVGKRIDLTMIQATVVPEASTLSKIRHPNVIEVVSAARVDPKLYDSTMDVIEIVTPYYPKGSITDYLLSGHSFSTRESILIIQSALQGLRELHVGHRILHRDIKSGNILLTDAPVHAVVADIGVAGVMSTRNEVQAVNNPTLYSPPELLTTGVLTPASDLYSLGLVMSELFGGVFHYSSYTREDVFNALESGRNPLRSSDFNLPIWAPSSLRKIHTKATATDAKKRYQAAKDMYNDLSKLKVANWSKIGKFEWLASGPTGSRVSCKVELTEVGGRNVLSVKRRTSSGWRRSPGFSDTVIEFLGDAVSQSVFDHANYLALS